MYKQPITPGMREVQRRKERSKWHQVVCLDCGHRGRFIRHYRGSLLVMVALYMFFIIPGIIYTWWFLTRGNYRCCRKCHSARIRDDDS